MRARTVLCKVRKVAYEEAKAYIGSDYTWTQVKEDPMANIDTAIKYLRHLENQFAKYSGKVVRPVLSQGITTEMIIAAYKRRISRCQRCYGEGDQSKF